MARLLGASLVFFALVSAGACIPDFASRDDILGPTTSSSSATTSSGDGTGGSGGQGGTGGVASSCTDGIANGDETDVDCGGSCGKCHLGKRCKTTNDCAEPAAGGGGAGGGSSEPITCDSRHVCAPPARGHWLQISPTSSPGPTLGHAMAFHAADRVVVLDGGSDNSQTPSFQSAVWRWDGSNWTTYPTVATTPKIRYATLVYEPEAERLLRFGGIDATGAISNTLEDFDGFAFYPIGLSDPPLPRQYHGAAFDAARHQMVVFGGIDAGTTYGDTWVYDYASDAWTKKAPITNLHATHEAALVYDTARQRVLIFGVEPALSHTLLWDGNDWLDAKPAHAPSPRYPGAFAYDDRRERVILFGGLGENTYVNDTWEWDGADWRQTATGGPSEPSGRLSAMAFDSNRGRGVLYGGSNASNALEDTWEYFATANGCTADAQCDTNYCVDGLCCDVASCDTCYACSADLEHAGRCAPVLQGEKDPTTQCTCDGHGACQ